MPTEKSERRIIYLERKEHGLCPRCGNKKRRPDSKYTYCVDCRLFFRDYQKDISESINESRKSRYQERKDKGECPRCGKKLGKRYKKTICENCLEKQYGYNTKKNKVRKKVKKKTK